MSSEEQLTLPGDLKPTSKYTLELTPQGFVIRRDGGYELPISYYYGALYLPANPVGYGLYGDGLLKVIGQHFTDLVAKNRRSKADKAEVQYMIMRALGLRVSTALAHVRANVAPPEVVELSKLMWASTQTHALVTTIPDLYTADWKHLYKDLLRYHAARLYAKSIENQLNDQLGLLAIAAWRKQLNTFDSRVMNKSLDHFPTGVSYKDIGVLGFAKLEKPITTRLHMIALIAVCNHHHKLLHMRTVSKASDKTIVEACAAINYAPTITRRSKQVDIAGAISHILDYGEAYNGDLVGLANRSREYHNNMLTGHRRYQTTLREKDSLTVVPQGVDLAKLREQGVVFLDSANAVIREGNHMQHCVARYADKAVEGQCYLFHVEHEGEEATIEVGRDGRILQAYGPRDLHNVACTYGTEALRRVFKVQSADGNTGQWLAQYEQLRRQERLHNIPRYRIGADPAASAHAIRFEYGQFYVDVAEPERLVGHATPYDPAATPGAIPPSPTTWAEIHGYNNMQNTPTTINQADLDRAMITLAEAQRRHDEMTRQFYANDARPQPYRLEDLEEPTEGEDT